MAAQPPPWMVAELTLPELAVTIRTHTGLFTADMPPAAVRCFIATFGTPSLRSHGGLILAPSKQHRQLHHRGKEGGVC